MKIIKEILGRFFALWAAIVFIGSLIIIAIPIWIMGKWPEPKRTIYVFKIFGVWMKFFFVFSGVRRIIKGREHFKKGENYVVVCNHNSFMDVPLSSIAIPPPNKTIAKAEMAKIPIFGIIYKSGSVLVDRKSEESRRKSFTKMKAVLEMGMHMCIYPEGTRNKTSQPLQRFHDGAFKLAVETNKQVIPSLIFYTSKVLPRKPFFFWPHKVEMHFLPAVPVENKTSHQLKEEVFEMMKTYLVDSGKLK
ncbi:MAG TPA: lysophospholipid acyltransferase family protein [Flavisolibacter sp.]|jgi:1-acyl-sn-glycerol-3-phosphate acyltransferase|nr:lysophospholipid acyltransferase family protein [Flavisolibacter sp.]